MIANYGDVIPRRDFEALEKKFKVGNFSWISLCFYCCFVFGSFVLLLFKKKSVVVDAIWTLLLFTCSTKLLIMFKISLSYHSTNQ